MSKGLISVEKGVGAKKIRKNKKITTKNPVKTKNTKKKLNTDKLLAKNDEPEQTILYIIRKSRLNLKRAKDRNIRYGLIAKIQDSENNFTSDPDYTVVLERFVPGFLKMGDTKITNVEIYEIKIPSNEVPFDDAYREAGEWGGSMGGHKRPAYKTSEQRCGLEKSMGFFSNWLGNLKEKWKVQYRVRMFSMSKGRFLGKKDPTWSIWLPLVGNS